MPLPGTIHPRHLLGSVADGGGRGVSGITEAIRSASLVIAALVQDQFRDLPRLAGDERDLGVGDLQEEVFLRLGEEGELRLSPPRT